MNNTNIWIELKIKNNKNIEIKVQVCWMKNSGREKFK